MNIGTIKEIKDNENRVGLIPPHIKQLTDNGHQVFVETHAGENSGYSNEDYTNAGAQILATPEDVAEKSDILVKVKEPLPSEYPLLKLLAGKTLYTYLHLSGVDPQLATELLDNKITGVAYETIEDEKGLLVCLRPMSEVAGVFAVQHGAEFMQRKYNGVGKTLGHIHNADKAKVVVIGGGVVGRTAARTAAGMGANVTVLQRKSSTLDALHQYMEDENLGPIASEITIKDIDADTVEKEVRDADLVIGAVLVTGAKAPVVVTEKHVKGMKKGAVIVDVAIDQGGCIWGTKATSHSEPTYALEGKIYSAIPNMPGQASMQSTQALTHATFPYLDKMANMGVLEALREDEGFAKGVNTHEGFISYKPVAVDLGLEGSFKKFE